MRRSLLEAHGRELCSIVDVCQTSSLRTRSSRMSSSRRFRSGSQSEPAPKALMDSVYSLNQIDRPFGSHVVSERYQPYGNVKRAIFEGGYQDERKRATFSSIVHDQLNISSSSSSTRRPSLSGRRHILPAPVLPGERFGYRRMWMQNNPWPDQPSREMGSRRESGHDYMHRMKFREPRRHLYTPSFVPGGNCHDPLNLSGSDTWEESIPQQIPEYEPDPYLPVNNFIPINRGDPLGLTQDEGDDRPLCLKYPLSKSKRKRSRNKKKENVSGDSQVDFADGVGTMSDAVPSEVTGGHSDSGTRDVGDSGNLHKSASENTGKIQPAESEVKESCNPTVDHASETRNLNHGLNSVSEKSEKSAMNENVSSEASGDAVGHSSLQSPITACCQTSGSGQVERKSSSDEILLAVVKVSKHSTTGGADNNMTEEIGISEVKVGCDGLIGDGIQPGGSGGTVSHGGESDDGGDHNPICDDRAKNADVSETHEPQKRGPAPHFRNRSASLLQGKRDSDFYRRMRPEYDQKMKEFVKMTQSFRSVYPMLQSPLDEEEKKHVPRNRKSLKKALRIEPMKPEEQEKINKEREQKSREFKQFWRPNSIFTEQTLERKEPAGQELTAKALTIDTNLSPEKNPQELPGSVLRTVDSISPVLRLDPSRICKRRRTISECSAESASKKVFFRRSISPQNSSLPSPRKIRRQTTGSGQVEQKTESEEKPRTTVKYSKNSAYKHGNYYRYYGYRTPAMAPDFRLYHFKKEWFEGKDVLDIGCNAGDVTLAVAQYFHPQKIVGMDIDPNLIRIARQNIRSHQTKANMYKMEKYPVSTSEYGPIEPLPALTNPSNIFPKNVMFMQGNYVLKSDEELDYVKKEYDTILALSITKWIHLNHGDEGLKRVFHRMFQQLRPGGRLILEPQTWASYRRRKKLSATIYKNYNSIQLKPNDFGDYLVNTVGFCKREFLGTPFNPSKGFQRSLWLFTKYIPTADNSPRHSESPATNHPSINERITYLAGYSPAPGGMGEWAAQQQQQEDYEDSEQLLDTSYDSVDMENTEETDDWQESSQQMGQLGAEDMAQLAGGEEDMGQLAGGEEDIGQLADGEEDIGQLAGDEEDIGQLADGEEDMGQLADGEEDMGQLADGEEDMGQLADGEEDIGQLADGEEDMGQLAGDEEDIGQLADGEEDMGQLADGEEDMGQLADGEDLGQLGESPKVCNGDIDHPSPAYSPSAYMEDPAAAEDNFYGEPNGSVSGDGSNDPVMGGGDFYAGGGEEDDAIGVGSYSGDSGQESSGGDDNPDSLLNEDGVYAANVDNLIDVSQLDEGSNIPEGDFPEGTGDSSPAVQSEADSSQPLPPVEADQPSPVQEDSPLASQEAGLVEHSCPSGSAQNSSLRTGVGDVVPETSSASSSPSSSSPSSSSPSSSQPSSRREHSVQHPEVSSSLKGARTSSSISIVPSVPDAAGPSSRVRGSSSQEVSTNPSHQALPESLSPLSNAQSRSPQVPSSEGDQSQQMSPESADPT